ncbi:DNA glycosylase superfamily protein [Striga asiatica]|uniref:DNA glycosylase superfamily protein n=1 Tax=Striga asiatica TaxID=4170 RepID=A0A5A7Q2G8_STRAF|nr:DNA glycosylase superfamily protein [Striga asiatica]
MSGPPKVKPTNFSELEARPVLGPAGNKPGPVELRKPALKLKCEKTEQTPVEAPAADGAKGNKSPVAFPEKIPSSAGFRRNSSSAGSILSQRPPNLSLNASCSSDASSDSTRSRASTGTIARRTMNLAPPVKKKQQGSLKGKRVESVEGNGKCVGSECDGYAEDGALVKKRCAWVTSNTDPLYAAFHDEEWGLPVHDDKKLFELLSFSTALAELTWPVILSKRTLFRDVFLDFDPLALSNFNDKKLTASGSPASSLLSELKLRSIVENARQVCKIIDEHGSFDKYIWGFVNYKPIVSNFRYARQVPIKTSKADTISKDLIRRGFRGVGPTVVYSFMQAVGLTNDHLVNCFRHRECVIAADLKEKEAKIEVGPHEDLERLAGDIDDVNLSR